MAEPAGAPAAVGGDVAPRISVIVPTWNEAKYLPALFESLRRQTVPPDEVIVADSGSSDGTADVACAAGDVGLQEERRRFGEGRNLGYAAAAAHVLVFVYSQCLRPSK